MNYILPTKLDRYKAVIKNYLNAKTDVVKSRTVPDASGLALLTGQAKIEGAVLYVDLVQSSQLSSEFQNRVAAKIIKAFLWCSSSIIQKFEGEIRSFDGDRVMALFIGEKKCENSVAAALTISEVMEKALRPLVSEHFSSMHESTYEIRHCSGIDVGEFLAVRVGVRGRNDLIWVGRAPNLAARLSEIRESSSSTFITEDVFKVLPNRVRITNDGNIAWRSVQHEFFGEQIGIFATNCCLPT